ncbi:hypothetical protein BO79DRAFT_213048 [Aspergillus costaricaensis CBS 115574]|uniref:Uncharacterized protein n=1 Tax=Aspergillus costaricaensis CBS 115574 TaxID=1448317 RepID=A0ACD1IT33_9EURO|nr:hypothetical protein BO79DRAFT_213048 [Aspergillus costaricaensis CBS 115574]RAK93420.1 hypothetical protein BO79DRAFT_213048 [Aspergillus costaricaensis CBS 115574]
MSFIPCMIPQQQQQQQQPHRPSSMKHKPTYATIRKRKPNNQPNLLNLGYARRNRTIYANQPISIMQVPQPRAAVHTTIRAETRARETTITSLLSYLFLVPWKGY